MSHFGGMSVFAQKKMCDYQRSSGHVVTRRGSTGRSTVPYRSTIDVRTHTGLYGVPTGPPGPVGTDGPPADHRRHRRTPFNRRLPGLGGPQILLASAVAIVPHGLAASRILDRKSILGFDAILGFPEQG